MLQKTDENLKFHSLSWTNERRMLEKPGQTPRIFRECYPLVPLCLSVCVRLYNCKENTKK